MIVHRIKRCAGRTSIGVDVYSMWLNQHMDLWCDDADTDYQRRLLGEESAMVTIYPKHVTCPKCIEHMNAAAVINHVKNQQR